MKKGFTLVEVLVGTAVFLVIATAVYQAYTSLFILIGANQYKILALNLANEQFEIVRNLAYSDVGETTGIPRGKIPHSQNLVRGGVTFTVTSTIRNIDLPFDGTIGGTPNDLSPADNKLVEVEVTCAACTGFSPITLTTTVAPRNLETASTNGALFIKVFDANGQEVVDAEVHVVNSAAGITIDDVTDINGMLQIVDVPPGANAYAITVTKPGYSTASTHAASVANPNPTQPDATVLIQQVTQVSLAIDRTSTLEVESLSPICAAIGNIDFRLTGSKLIGENLLKYSHDHATNGSGMYSNSSMEWDSYTIANIDDAYDVVGVNSLNSFALNPNSSQHVALLVAPKNPRTLLVTVKDANTGLPISDATVVLEDDEEDATTQITDRGYINQTDWSGGAGQEAYTDLVKYFSDDGNIETGSPDGELELRNVFGSHAAAGSIVSSVFDVGIPSNYNKIIWTPTDQPPAAGADSVKFQFATNDEVSTTTWNYTGPDGTSATYYTLADTTLHSIHNGHRYARYKVFLSTESDTVTPNISDIAFTYTSSCTPPGQVVFSGLESGTHTLTVSKSGYTTVVDEAVSISDPWAERIITLSTQ